MKLILISSTPMKNVIISCLACLHLLTHNCSVLPAILKLPVFMLKPVFYDFIAGVYFCASIFFLDPRYISLSLICSLDLNL